MRLINDHILKKVHGNAVLVPTSDRETDFHGMVVLNHTAEFLCRLLQRETDRDTLVAELAKEYEAAPERVAADVDAFVSELDACHLLIR